MIFEKSLRKELAFTTGVVFMVLFTLVTTNLMIRLLGSAAGGNINPKDVLVLIGLGMISQLGIIATASLFVSCLIVLTRWYKDSEMVIWQGAGLSLFSILQPILRFSASILFIAGVLNIFVSPWANEQSEIIRRSFQQRDDLSMLAPGQFKESNNNNRILFTESINPENNVIKNLFVSDFGKDGQRISIANTGYIENTTSGDKQLVLNNGRHYTGTPGTPNFRITEFDKYTVLLNSKNLNALTRTNNMLPIWTLANNWQDKNSQGEIFWRLSITLMTITLVILAIPLSYVDPRKGRYSSLIIAVLIYFSYSNILKVIQSSISSGNSNFYIYIWLPHLSLVLLGVTMIYFRQNQSIKPVKNLISIFNK